MSNNRYRTNIKDSIQHIYYSIQHNSINIGQTIQTMITTRKTKHTILTTSVTLRNGGWKTELVMYLHFHTFLPRNLKGNLLGGNLFHLFFTIVFRHRFFISSIQITCVYVCICIMLVPNSQVHVVLLVVENYFGTCSIYLTILEHVLCHHLSFCKKYNCHIFGLSVISFAQYRLIRKFKTEISMIIRKILHFFW